MTKTFHLAFGAAACALALAATPAMADDHDITLSGCLVQANDGDGYLVTNAPAEPAMVGTSGRDVAPNAFGSDGRFASVLYWLDDDNDLKPHVGHRVEVQGELKGDVKEGELKVDHKDKWTELEIKADGKTLHANVPHTSVVTSKDAKAPIMVRRVDVEKVKMLGATCN